MSARVLVVDDVAPNIRILEAKLSTEYFYVLTATNGPEALESAARDNPDIILLDVMMPDMDGFEVCRRLKADPAVSHIPVVMVTALSDMADRIQGLEAGADDFLTKPVNDLALFSRVRSLVRLKMTMDELKLRRQTGQHFGQNHSESEMQVDGASVLVIDDNRSDAKHMERHMGERFRMTFEADAEKALALAGTHPYDLIIVSLDHRGADPLRLTSSIRNIPISRQTPILLVGEESDAERVAKALEMGVNDYILRPIEASELMARAKTQIRRKRYQDMLRQDVEHSIAMAVTDPLTGLHNRGYFDQHLETALQRLKTSGKGFSLIMLDIDHFKAVNDTHGHPAGDRILKEFAARLTSGTRGFDLTARYGGEEFVIVLPDADLRLAECVAERLRGMVEDQPFDTGEEAGMISVTCSLGVAEACADDDRASVLKKADQCLYKAKQAGRNQVVVAA
ncbi:MAG: PleD family two-component system response regulator [Minwuia sp.]|uniref:PleD family two-component system response regulator n=1 Tax=Minwuia sp. TaxID=2493630 RepID=UPI003A8B0D2C